MKHKRTIYGKCYYCICTACSGSLCPFKHKLFRCCYYCQERRIQSPRFDCDFFTHYIKHRIFKFKRSKSPLPAHSGTYILNSNGVIFVGKYNDLLPIAQRLGGQLRKVGIYDFLIGDWK